VPGIGEQTEQRLLAALARPDPVPAQGLLLHRARELCEGVAGALGGVVAGDVRRWRDVCERLAVVVAAHDAAPVLQRFEELAAVVSLLEREPRAALGVTLEGVPIRLGVPAPARLGTELLVATGSAAYVTGLGALPDAPEERLVYEALGVPYCPPELRELPFRGEPPVLVELGDIRGDLHVHTTWSDGRASVEELGLAARARNYDYLAVCDHTPAVGAVRGLDGDAVRRQAEEIVRANERLAPFRLLRGSECDIRPDGSLDLPDDVLAELEWVQISVHAGQRAPARELTRRVVAAMNHPAACCLSHPKGRIINRRPENALDLDEVFAAAVETGVAVEVNGLPNRLDLRGELVREAIAAGVAVVCSSDSHSAEGLQRMELAVATARRGGATRGDVVNARPLDRLRPRPGRGPASRRRG
jgi:DNA polymerase (family 10)